MKPEPKRKFSTHLTGRLFPFEREYLLDVGGWQYSERYNPTRCVPKCGWNILWHDPDRSADIRRAIETEIANGKSNKYAIERIEREFEPSKMRQAFSNITRRLEALEGKPYPPASVRREVYDKMNSQHVGAAEYASWFEVDV